MFQNMSLRILKINSKFDSKDRKPNSIKNLNKLHHHDGLKIRLLKLFLDQKMESGWVSYGQKPHVGQKFDGKE